MRDYWVEAVKAALEEADIPMPDQERFEDLVKAIQNAADVESELNAGWGPSDA